MAIPFGRLKRAAQLLQKSQFTISETAYQVGHKYLKLLVSTKKKNFKFFHQNISNNKTRLN
jgi:AraC-like DNA-binding protein